MKEVFDVPSVTDVISVCGDLRCTPAAPGGVGLATDDELLEELLEELLAVNAAWKDRGTDDEEESQVYVVSYTMDVDV
jgi:hypothetical protein